MFQFAPQFALQFVFNIRFLALPLCSKIFYKFFTFSRAKLNSFLIIMVSLSESSKSIRVSIRVCMLQGLSTMKLNSCIQTTVIIINCDIFIFIFLFLFLLHMTFTSFQLFYQRHKTLKILSKIS